MLDHDILVDAGTGVGDLTMEQMLRIDIVESGNEDASWRKSGRRLKVSRRREQNADKYSNFNNSICCSPTAIFSSERGPASRC